MLIGRRGKSLIERMLLNPSIVMDWNVSEAMAFPNIFADHIAAGSSCTLGGETAKPTGQKCLNRRTAT
jgi:hypothetical protein